MGVTNNENMGAFFLFGKSKSGFRNPKTDRESIKSTLWVDCSDEIQSERYLGKEFEKKCF